MNVPLTPLACAIKEDKLKELLGLLCSLYYCMTNQITEQTKAMMNVSYNHQNLVDNSKDKKKGPLCFLTSIDLAAWSDEIDKDKSPNAISCYMYEHGVSEEVSREHVKALIDKAWMKMIEAEIVCSEHMTDPLFDMAINLLEFQIVVYDGIKESY
ncbi:(E)-beta-ocimene synthase, chloroplastic [Tanacetum coccineum]